jgi:hypothetical protein
MIYSFAERISCLGLGLLASNSKAIVYSESHHSTSVVCKYTRAKVTIFMVDVARSKLKVQMGLIRVLFRH